jgi:hypothetical protein
LKEIEVTMPLKDKWRMVSALGSWHKVAANKAFRFYIRINQNGEKWCFADYRIDDLVSRFHRLEQLDGQGIEPSWRAANTKVLNMTREQLADLEE